MVNRLKAVYIENRSWLLLATSLFILSYTFSFMSLTREPQLFALFEEKAIPFIRELGDLVFSGNPFIGCFILFTHNLTISLQVIILGIILGIPSLFSTLGNGTMLGAVAALLAQEGIIPLHFFIFGILPHGIFELPAFLISAAFGLKLGYHIVFPLPDQGRKATLKQIFNEIKNALPLIISMLAIAALLEVFVTPGLIRAFLQ